MISPIDFEVLVKDLYQLEAVGFTAFHNKKYKGLKSEHSHQIDFSLEGMIAGISVLILGECKQYKMPVSLDKVMSFAYRVHDIAAQKGILVSSNGFQAGAYKIAKSSGIALVVCRNNTLDTVLARGQNKIKNVAEFLNALTSGSDSLEYAVMQSDSECLLIDKRSLYRVIIGQ